MPNKTNYNNNIIKLPIPKHIRLFDNCVNPKKTIEGTGTLVEQPIQKMKNINNKVTNLEKLRVIKSVLKDLIPGKKYGISEQKKTELCQMISIMAQELEKNIDAD